MCNMKKYFYIISMFCFLTVSFPFHLWSEESSKKIPSSTPKDKDTQAQVPVQKHPQISFDSTKYNAGEVWEGEKISHSFTVKNTGEAELTIYKVKPGWGCTVASFDKAIPPGQEGKITLKANTANMKGVFSKSATVHSNDPQHLKTRITLSCIVKQYISVLPANKIKLKGCEGDKIKRKVTITSPEGLPFEITDISSNIEDKIKYKLKTTKKGKEYTLKVKNRSTKEDRFRGNIIVKTSIKKKPHIVIPVYGELMGKVDISSKNVYFGTIDTTRDNFGPRGLRKNIVLKDIKGDGLVIEKIKTSSDWIVIETKKRGTKQYTIIITLDKDRLPKGQFNEKIKIRTNYKGKTLEVDVMGQVI